MKRWHVTVTVPHLSGASIRELTIAASTRAEARTLGLQVLRKREPNLFDVGHLEGVPRATARPE